MKCNAKSKTTGAICRNNAMHGKEKCRMHGGLSPSGAESPHYRTGKYSRYLPARLIATYEASQADPEKLQLGHEVSLVEARLIELMGKIDTGESGEVFKQLRATYTSLFDAIFNKAEEPLIRFEMGTLDRLIREGAGHWAIWVDIQRTVDSKRKLVESERNHAKAMQQMVSIEQMLLLVGALLATVKQHVPDPQALAAISDDFGKFLDLHAGRAQ